MDIFTKEKRSQIMSNVKTEGTDIEKSLRECVRPLWEKWRYRKNLKTLPGKPDIVFVKQKLAIFVDGDFWHGRNSEKWLKKTPDFWQDKISKNIARDKKQNRQLKKDGYL